MQPGRSLWVQRGSSVGGASPRTAEGKWGRGERDLALGECPQSWGSIGVRWGHPTAAQGGGGCTLHLRWQGPGRATPRTVPLLQDSPTPPAALWGAAQPLTPERRWGARPAPDGWAASSVGSRSAPRARGSAQLLLPPLPRRYQVHLPGAALPASTGGGSALLYPTASEGLHSRPSWHGDCWGS